MIYDNNFLHHYENIKHNFQLNITGRQMKIAKPTWCVVVAVCCVRTTHYTAAD